ncbi:MAG: TM2 domain-containing protein [Rubrivivax sp.]
MPADTPARAPADTPAQPAAAASSPYRSKTAAAWLALLFGAIGLHRIYLNGANDKLAWAHVPFTALGLVGAERMATLGQDDRLGEILVPVLEAHAVAGHAVRDRARADTRRALGRAPQPRLARARHRHRARCSRRSPR